MSTDLTAGGAAYLAKLHRSRRDKAVIAAFLVLLLALIKSRSGQALAISSAALLLAQAISRDVAKRMGIAPAVAPLAQEMELRITYYATRALAGGASPEKLAQIAIAETQQATVRATQTAAASATSITRRTSGGPRVCPQCAALAGTYTPPYPSDLYWTHPNCACTWSAN